MSDAEKLLEAVAKAQHQDDTIAHGLVGAFIGNLRVLERKKTEAGRWVYLAVDGRNGEVKAMRGYELVRAAREARQNGLPLILRARPWRDEPRRANDTGEESQHGEA